MAYCVVKFEKKNLLFIIREGNKSSPIVRYTSLSRLAGCITEIVID